MFFRLLVTFLPMIAFSSAAAAEDSLAKVVAMQQARMAQLEAELQRLPGIEEGLAKQTAEIAKFTRDFEGMEKNIQLWKQNITMP